MLYSYGDESGTHGRSPVISVALAISTEFHWLRFEEEWREAVLRPNGIDVFHMREFACRTKSFYRCPDDRWGRTLERIVHILERRVKFRLAVGLDVAAFGAIKEAARSESTKARVLAPYTQCVVAALNVAGIVLDRYSVPDMVAYIFESGHKNWGETASLLTEWEQDDKHRKRLRIQSFAPGRKAELVQLQASDALAYAAAQAWIARNFPDTEHQLSVESVAALIHRPQYLEKDKLVGLYDEIGGKMRLLRTQRQRDRARRKRGDV